MMSLREKIAKLAEKVESAESMKEKDVDRESMRKRIAERLKELREKREKEGKISVFKNEVLERLRKRIALRRAMKRRRAERLERLRKLQKKSELFDADEKVSMNGKADRIEEMKERLKRRIALLKRRIGQVGGGVNDIEKNFDPKSEKSYGLSVPKPSVATGAEMKSLKKRQLEKAPPVLFADERVAKVALLKTLTEVDGNELKGVLYDMLVGIGVKPKIAVNIIESSVKKSAKKVVEYFVKKCQEVAEMPEKDLEREEKELVMYLTLTEDGSVEGEFEESGKEEEKVEGEGVPNDVAVEAEEIKQKLTAGSVKVPRVASADDNILAKAVAGYNTFKI